MNQDIEIEDNHYLTDGGYENDQQIVPSDLIFNIADKKTILK